MSTNKNVSYTWRRLFSHELSRADHDCDDVWIRHDKFKLVKFPSSRYSNGKWGIFTPLEVFMDRCSSKYPPTDWANKIIAQKMHDRKYRSPLQG